MIEVRGTLDIECADWDRFLVGATFNGDVARLHRSPEAMRDYLREQGGHWWAHCGGRYDFLSIANVLHVEGRAAQMDYPHGRISRLVTRGFVLRDSYGLLPFGLERVAELAEVSVPKLPWRCVCGRRCGGYCQLSGLTPATVDPDVEDYCVADAKTLYAGLQALNERAAEWGIELRGTIGSSAWETAQRDLKLPDVDYDMPTWERIRAASFGGRDVIARPKAKGIGVAYDIASAYPAALAIADLPVGRPFELGARDASVALNNDRPGVYECTVTVPESYVPPLPWRAPSTERVAYPIGRVHGSWCLPELVAAVERGATIEEVHSAITFPEERNLFGAWIARLYAIRRKIGKRTAWGEWLRLFCNSLTGKFAESPLRTTIRMHPERVKVCLRQKRCRNGCTGRCGAYRPINDAGTIWAQPYFRLGPSSHAHWAVYLRALCRIHWLEGAEASGPDELVYAATDSLWTTSTRSPGRTGDALGSWDLQHAWSHWECRAKGIYRFRKLSGAVVIRASGVRDLTPGEWRAGVARRKDGVWSLVAAAQRGRDLFTRRELEWTLPKADDRAWYGDRRIGRDGRTYPTTCDEQIERDLTKDRKRRTVAGDAASVRSGRGQEETSRARVGLSQPQAESTAPF